MFRHYPVDRTAIEKQIHGTPIGNVGHGKACDGLQRLCIIQGFRQRAARLRKKPLPPFGRGVARFAVCRRFRASHLESNNPSISTSPDGVGARFGGS